MFTAYERVTRAIDGAGEGALLEQLMDAIFPKSNIDNNLS